MFHDVLLLGKGGRTVYLGPSERALEYFESLGFPLPEAVNPPDFFMDVIAGAVEPTSDPLGLWNDNNFQPESLFDAWEQRSSEFSRPSSFADLDGNIGKQQSLNREDLDASFIEKDDDGVPQISPEALAQREKGAVSRSTAGFFMYAYCNNFIL